MIVKQAREVARQWVIEKASILPGFVGAFLAGSTNWLPDNAPLPPTSDMDIMMVLADSDPPNKPGKFTYQDALLELSYLPADRLESPEQILCDYHVAASFSTARIIADPSGWLAERQAVVSAEYANRRWVGRRCQQARDKAVAYLEGVDESEPFHDQVSGWLFGTGITTHVLLVAGLKNPTVRQRYLAARQLLASYGYLDLYETLLEVLGCARMSRERAEYHLASLAGAFDAAKTVIKTPFFFASDLSDAARPIAIDGSRELIEGGYHREAIFWMVATYSRCQKVFYHDAPRAMQERFTPGYRQLLADLGIRSFADMQQRKEEIKALLPRVWAVAEAIMAANPAIED